MTIPAHFRLSCSPQASTEAIVRGSGVRFTVLSSRVIRIERAPDGRFEDRPSQVFWFRRQDVPEFETVRAENRIEIITEHLHLSYDESAGAFSAESLSITLRENGPTWHFGDQDNRNLLGTARTLDMVSGCTQLEPGLLSRSGWTVVDDSSSLVFDEQGWLRPRETDCLDLYFFGYGLDYAQCLRDFCHLAGHVPLLPRWALGNWWSRYWPYTADELLQLMDDFSHHQVPLSVCIVDMDWHIVDTGRGTSGWTGYTWNKELFPDPPAFIKALHDRGLKTALNLHPALGVRAHEEMYADMAKRIGLDPATEETVAFDIAEPAFACAYCEVLHHPREEEGVDFWWIDWQQERICGLPGLDPLWWLNHLHYKDLGRDGRKRPFIFSRWGGLGNHRYPIGFSGDTVINWESLAFQPYFTATAANVAYGYWSHDIGGHMWGIEEPELYARWVQYGAFSPILRLHSTQNQFHERRPWGYDAEVFRITREAMQLRHALIPYLYTMSWRNAVDHIPTIRPMYHDYPDRDEAYACPQQYLFGSELVAAPFTSPADEHTRLGRQVIWLPTGEWHDFFTGEYFEGGNWYAIYGDLGDIPVYARAGAIVPMDSETAWNSPQYPAALDIRVFAGANNKFTLYEDDGETTGYLRGEFCSTKFEQVWQSDQMTLSVSAAEGDTRQLPSKREFRFHIFGVSRPAEVVAQIGRVSQRCEFSYDADAECVHLMPLSLSPREQLRLSLVSHGLSLRSRRDRLMETCLRMLRSFKLESMAKAGLADRMAAIRKTPALMAEFGLNTTPSQVRALLEVTQQAGVHHVRNTRDPDLLLLWNNHEKPRLDFRFSRLDQSSWQYEQRFRAEGGAIPRFKAITPRLPWHLAVDYFGQTVVELTNREGVL